MILNKKFIFLANSDCLRTAANKREHFNRVRECDTCKHVPRKLNSQIQMQEWLFHEKRVHHIDMLNK